VAPRAVLVSVGAGNGYRHPDTALLAGLARSGATVRRTDQSGDIAVTAGPDADGRAVQGGSGAPDLYLVQRGDPLRAPR
jgi:competence protein ComEC